MFIGLNCVLQLCTPSDKSLHMYSEIQVLNKSLCSLNLLQHINFQQSDFTSSPNYTIKSQWMIILNHCSTLLLRFNSEFAVYCLPVILFLWQKMLREKATCK